MLNRLFAYNPNLKQSWILLGVLCCLQLLAGVIVGIVVIIGGNTLRPWAELAGSVLSYIIMAFIVVRLGKGNNYEPIASPRQSPLLWLLLVPFTLSLGPAMEPLTAWIPMPDAIQQLFAELMTKNMPMFLLIAVVAPVCEEWLFRGIILKGLLTRYSPLKAIVWSAVIFAVIHLNPWQGIPAFIIGLILGWLYWHTRSLRYCIFVHAVNNAASFVFSVFLFPDASADATIADIAGGYYIYAVALLVCVFTGIWVKNIISSGTLSDKNTHQL